MIGIPGLFSFPFQKLPSRKKSWLLEIRMSRRSAEPPALPQLLESLPPPASGSPAKHSTSRRPASGEPGNSDVSRSICLLNLFNCSLVGIGSGMRFDVVSSTVPSLDSRASPMHEGAIAAELLGLEVCVHVWAPKHEVLIWCLLRPVGSRRMSSQCPQSRGIGQPHRCSEGRDHAY